MIIGFTDIFTLGTTTSSLFGDDDGIHISNDEILTTITISSLSALLNGCSATKDIQAEAATKYVQSMSDEELDSLIEKIDIKESSITNEKVKVKALGSISFDSNKHK